MNLKSPVPLDKSHDTGSFNCGVEPLNEFLHKYALTNRQNRSARTYVAMRGSGIAGYYTLANGSVSRAEAPVRVVKGLGNYPVPVTLLARLAVDISEKGKGWDGDRSETLSSARFRLRIWSAAAQLLRMRRTPPPGRSTTDFRLRRRRLTSFISTC